MRTRTTALLATIAAATLLTACGGGSPAAAPATVTVTAAAPAMTVPAVPAVQPVPATATIPDLKGQNGAIAEETLKGLGLTNIRLAADAKSGKSVVVLPENWTVTKIEPSAGNRVPTTQLVVLTMTK